MEKINRFDVYAGHFVDEAADLVDSWGNRKEYKDTNKYIHLGQNMNGWLAEHFFKETFPGWEFIDEEAHNYICRDSEEAKKKRVGLPDFYKEQETAEVKAYKDYDTILKKVEWWKQFPKELHCATFVYTLDWNSKKWFLLNRETWKLEFVRYSEFPNWYRGRCFYEPK